MWRLCVCVCTKLLFLRSSFHHLLPQCLLMFLLVSLLPTLLTDFRRPSPLHLHIAITKNLICLQIMYQRTSKVVIDSVALAKIRRVKPTRSTNQENMQTSRTGNWKWKKDNLVVSWNSERTNVYLSKSSKRSQVLLLCFSNIIITNCHNRRVLFKTIKSAINSLYAAIWGPFIVLFKRYNCQTVASSSPLDVIPARFLKEVFNSVGPTVLSILNSSLSTGCVPSCLKHAVQHPLLKKPILDPLDYKKIGPHSKLQFLLKVLEKVVYFKLISFMNNHNVFDKFQSGFHSRHSTETALIQVTNDVLLIAVAGDCIILILLDLILAFDTVHHCLEKWVGISDTALEYLKSYLSNRTFFCGPSDLWCSPRLNSCPPVILCMYCMPLGHYTSAPYSVPLLCGWPTNLCSIKHQRTVINLVRWMSQNYSS